MGVPDFLKFVARSSPRALCRVPHSGSKSSLLRFDYILIDATNVDQTIGIDALLEFLKLPSITVRKAVIFALDSQRSREGTMRHHRQSHTMIGDLDVRVQRMCVSLTEHYRLQLQGETDGSRYGSAPMVLVSGRNVAGEADYKIMDLHRTITTAHLLVQEGNLPSFLFISEDSDILCSALCGPAPQTISIATNLRSTTFDLCILRVEHVLEYVADCVEALKSENDAATGATSSVTLEQSSCAPPIKTIGANAPDIPSGRQYGDEKPRDGEDDVPRRRRKDGPNVATGVRIELTESSADDEDEDAGGGTSTAPLESATAAPAPQREDATASLVDSRRGVSLNQFCKEAGHIVGTTCVDLVFLFVLIMGNGANVPPLGRGVTKVDIASCWQAYCHRKYLGATADEKVMGRTLLDYGSSTAEPSVSSMRDTPNESQHLVSLSLDCSYLYSILRSVHYADDQSRAPVEEEKDAAREFLSNAVYVTLRYLIGCNLEGGATLTETFLDSRPLLEVETRAPNLAAVLWLLGQQQRLSFRFLLSGSGLKNLNTDPALDGHLPVGAVHTDRKTTNTPSSLQLDVREALVSPTPAFSWAVRGAGSRNYFLKVVTSSRNDPILFSSVPSPDGCGISVSSLVRQYATHRADAVAATDSKKDIRIPIFNALIATWRRSVMIGIPHLQKLSSVSTLTVSDSPAKHVEPTHSDPLLGVSMTNTVAQIHEQTNHGKSSDTQAAEGEDLVYSFELRRMVPVLCSTSGQSNQLGKGVKGFNSSEKEAALRSVLGISLDYTRQDLATSDPKSEPTLPRTTRGRDNKDHAERTRVRKIPRKEKNTKDMTASRPKTHKVQQKELATSASHPVKKMRPGRKERRKMAQKRQVANTEK
ncbi:unnamed protein product [Phytomonas sp. EM1]|nr:unnamed protein product [Phytomonas sp. EM1]|eukprot:CCW60019.1 unnamed protein product [Phytomonas sp. isolate EM1]